MTDRRRELRETAFRFRYAMEQLTAAITKFATVYRQAVETELAERAHKRARDRELTEAEYQEWKRQQEERSQ